MSLDTYRRKRDFGKTPEPAGATDPARRGPPAGDRRYVVQRHRATRLHYDLRLEINGVLMSWAVPKGPTLDPAQKRMAVHVEDHPLEYFDFEGVIPRGQYGAGDVIVWDWGHFEPEETDDPGKAVRGGELKFSLDGEKLKGRFTLVRTSGRGGALAGAEDGKENWLLIHKRDEFARDGWDAEHHPASVKTGRTNDEVKAGMPAVWDSGAQSATAEIDLSRAVEAPMPEFVEPMRATLADRPFSDPDWLFEIKWDGYRVEAVVDRGRVRLWTRNRNDAGRYFPDLLAPASWIDARQAVVDGEVVAIDEEGRPSFSLLQDLTGIKAESGRTKRGRPMSDEEKRSITLVYHLFDLLYLDGRSLLDVPLEARKRLLRSVLREHDTVRYGSHVEADGEAFHEAAANRGLEGMIAKLRHGRYEPGRRSRAWLKLKIRREQELVVGGYLPGKGNAKDLGALIVGVYDDGTLRHAGQVGSGFSARTRKELSAKLDELRRDDPPFSPPPRLPGARWSDPQIVIRAEFAEWTTDGLLRQAAFKGLDPEKDPRAVTREVAVSTEAATRSAERAAAKQPAARSRPASAARAAAKPAAGARWSRSDGEGRGDGGPPQAATAEELAALDAMKKAGTWHVGGHDVALSNLDKVLFPDDGITKRDLIRYYVWVAPTMLPYLRGRALNLWRWPNGITGSHFWQKEIPGHAPDWIARWSYPEAGSSEAHTYIVADRVATMAWLGNHATIDMHPWTSRTEADKRPTYALIDVDPGTRTEWDDVLLLARLYRTALQHLGVTAFPKVTGRRGIQAWIPLKPIYTFDQTRSWVERLSRAIGQTVPDLVSWEWEKTSRRGRARLDYTQNAVNKTLVAPYAVRPSPGAPVSTPISWDELDDPQLRPNRWTIRSLAARLDEKGDLFAPLLTMEQELPAL